MNQLELAQVLGVDRLTINRLGKQGILHGKRRGAQTMYPLLESVRAYIIYRKQLLVGRQPALLAARVRRARSEADRGEMHLERLRQELVPAKAAQAYWEEFRTWFGKRAVCCAQTLSRRCEGLSAPPEIAVAIDEHIAGLLLSVRQFPKSKDAIFRKHSGANADA